MNRFSSWKHKLAHLLHYNMGKVVNFIDDKGRAMIGFKCEGCGKLLVNGKYIDEPKQR